MKLTHILMVLAGSCAATIAIGQRTVPPNYTGPVNYVKTWEPTAPVHNPATVLTAPNSDAKMTTQYIDGLARPFQTVVRKGSLQTGASATDMVAPQQYDDLGREAFKYLPYAEITANDGAMKAAAFTNQATVMSGQFSGQGETWYYNQTDFEASPLNRPAKQMAAGNSWVGSGRGVSIKYWNNTATDDVKKWNVGDIANELPFNTTSGASTGSYAAGELVKTITIDEHDKQVIEFKDKDGKVLLKKVQLTGTADDGSGQGYTGWLCTYYLYDIYNNLRCVIQPKGVELLNIWGWDIEALGAILTEQCFLYAYDQNNRMTIKKVPGAGEVRMVYDKFDRLVMTQDANMRTGTAKWLVTKYDNVSRPIETGLWENSSAFSTHLSTAAGSGAYPTTSTGYTSLTISHYDNYSSLPSGLSAYNSSLNSTHFESITTFPYPETPVAETAVKGKVSWTQTRVLGTSTFLNAVTYYDAKGRVIQVQSTNLTGGTDIISTQYTWAGQPYITIQQQQNNSSTHTTVIVTKYSYDELNRLAKVEKKQGHPLVNSGAMSVYKTIAENLYDKQGQLKHKKLAPAFNSPTGLETMSYDYNIRGWMLGANRDYAKDTDNGHYFGFDLGYDKMYNGIIGNQPYGAAQYNGNITGMVWKTKGDGEKRKYDFRYDAANRITKAGFTQYTGSSFNQTANVNYDMAMGTYDGNGTYQEDGYDANGNILKMQQSGLKVNSSSVLDKMTYQYIANSNKLLSVTEDAAIGITDNKLGDFTDKNTANDDYDYDANGNLQLDKNKAISSITYNHLNLPAVITVTGKGTITYTYDAAGIKLRKITNETSATVTDGASTYNNINIITTTDYIAGFVFESKTYSGAASGLNYSNKLQFAGHEEGRIRALYYHATQAHTLTGFAYDYMLKDHLGNVRSLLTDEVKQDIYPAATLEGSASTGARVIEKKFYDIQEGAISDINFMPGVPVYYNNNSIPNPNPSGNENAANHYTYKLNTSTYKTGLGIVLKVMAGDKINIFGRSYYVDAANQADNNYLVPLNIINSLLNAATGVTTGKAVVSDLTGNTTGTVYPLQSYLNTHTPSASNKPRAFINYIFFDEKFEYAGGNASEVGSAYSLKQHHGDLTDIAVPKNGYIYVYCSNESNVNVWFDNLQLVHDRGQLLEETHYYPFGLTMKQISTKAALSLENIVKFNGKEKQVNEFADGSGLEMYDFGARIQDPQLGRWLNTDPMSEKYLMYSPYNFTLNNPLRFIDPNGMEVEEVAGGVKFTGGDARAALEILFGFKKNVYIKILSDAKERREINDDDKKPSYGNWAVFATSNLSTAAAALRSFSDKSLENLVLFNHGQVYNGESNFSYYDNTAITKENMVITTSEIENFNKKDGKNLEKGEWQVSLFKEMGNKIKDGGNFVYGFCYTGHGKAGEKAIAALSELQDNRLNTFLPIKEATATFTRYSTGKAVLINASLGGPWIQQPPGAKSGIKIIKAIETRSGSNPLTF